MSIRSTNKSKNELYGIAGWLGVILLLGNYILLSFGAIAGVSLLYQALALLGCLLIAIEAWYKKDLQPVVLNLIFVLIAVITLVRILFLQ
jgi:hypothetical protein